VEAATIEKWGHNKDVELFLMLNGHINFETQNVIDKVGLT
jgi:hypothetical protein